MASRRNRRLPVGRAAGDDATEVPLLSATDERRLMASSVFQGRTRHDDGALLMSISDRGQPDDPAFIWFGDAPFADLLDQDTRVSCLPSGRIPFADPSTFIPAMAARCCDEILAAHPTGPLRLGGFCFDAWIAYDVAARLIEHGRVVERVIMIECYTLDRFEERFNTAVSRSRRLITGSWSERFDQITDAIRSRRGAAGGGSSEPTGDDPTQSLKDRILAVTHDAIDAYDVASVDVDIDLIFGSESWHASYYRLAPRLGLARAGWHRTAGGRLTTSLSPGDHHTILESGCVEPLARLVQQRIDDGASGLAAPSVEREQVIG